MEKNEQLVYFALKPLLSNINRDVVITRSDIERYADAIVKPVLDGDTDSLGAFVELKLAVEVLQLAMEKIYEDAKTEAIKYNKGQSPTHTYGATVEFQQGGKIYDYDNNPSILALQKNVKKLQDLAKTITTAMVFPETGEMIYPAKVSYKKDSIKVTFKKGA